MMLLAVLRSGSPACGGDFHPSIGNTAQCGVMAASGSPPGLIIFTGPAALFPNGVEREPDPGLVQGAVAGLAAAHTAILAGFHGDGCGAPAGLQLLMA